MTVNDEGERPRRPAAANGEKKAAPKKPNWRQRLALLTARLRRVDWRRLTTCIVAATLPLGIVALFHGLGAWWWVTLLTAIILVALVAYAYYLFLGDLYEARRKVETLTEYNADWQRDLRRVAIERDDLKTEVDELNRKLIEATMSPPAAPVPPREPYRMPAPPASGSRVRVGGSTGTVIDGSAWDEEPIRRPSPSSPTAQPTAAPATPSGTSYKSAWDD